jgi:hypothetical protein
MLTRGSFIGFQIPPADVPNISDYRQECFSENPQCLIDHYKNSKISGQLRRSVENSAGGIPSEETTDIGRGVTDQTLRASLGRRDELGRGGGGENELLQILYGLAQYCSGSPQDQGKTNIPAKGSPSTIRVLTNRPVYLNEHDEGNILTCFLGYRKLLCEYHDLDDCLFLLPVVGCFWFPSSLLSYIVGLLESTGTINARLESAAQHMHHEYFDSDGTRSR